MNKEIIGFTAGNFDLLHPGYIITFEEAKRHCDRLLVFLQIDPSAHRKSKYKPVIPLYDRYKALMSIKYVDEVRMYDTEDDLLALLTSLDPDVRIIGADHKGKPYTGDELDIEIYFNSRDHGYSSSSLRKRVYEAEKAKVDWKNSRR